MDVASTKSNSAVNIEPKIAAAKEGSGPSLDYNAFLTLLMAQMQNQDPLEPLKSSDYVAQLATFSQVEKSVEMNARLGEVLSAVQMQQAGGLIGQKVTSADGLTSGTVAAARISDGGVVAILTDGQEISMGAGVVVGEKSA